MHILKHTVKIFITTLILIIATIGMLVVTHSVPARAQTADSIERISQNCEESGGEWDGQRGECVTGNNIKTDCDAEVLDQSNCGIVRWLVILINFLSALAGMAIIASIMIAGYEYMTARDNAGQIQKARTRIVWALSALALFIFGYALLNYLVPGGVL